jgi:cytosine/adenosine deaminase-related metal-dependent hydrolase
MLITNIRIFDGSGAAPFDGEVLIEGDRIVQVGRSGDPALASAGVEVISGGGAT